MGDFQSDELSTPDHLYMQARVKFNLKSNNNVMIKTTKEILPEHTDKQFRNLPYKSDNEYKYTLSSDMYNTGNHNAVHYALNGL